MLVYECLMIMLMLCKSSYAMLIPEVLQRRAHVAEPPPPYKNLVLRFARPTILGKRRDKLLVDNLLFPT